MCHAAPPPTPRSWTGRAVQGAEEGFVAHLGAQLLRIVEHALALIEAGAGCLRVQAGREFGVAREERRLQRLGVDHVVWHDQELLALRPAVVLGHHRGQLGLASGRGVTAQQQGQDGHEVALTGTEAAVQVRALAHSAVDRALDHPERLVEALHQLGRGDVVAHGFRRGVQAIRQTKNKVALVDLLWQVKYLA